MAERITPNPHSPYADADPEYRHLIASFLGCLPDAGALATAACGRMAVTPETEMSDIADGMPDGLCPTCVSVATEGGAELPAVAGTCHTCGSPSSHGDLCALCRHELHGKWWPTRGQADGGAP